MLTVFYLLLDIFGMFKKYWVRSLEKIVYFIFIQHFYINGMQKLINLELKKTNKEC